MNTRAGWCAAVREALGLRWTLVVAAPESDFTADTRRAWTVSLAVIAALVLLAALIAVLVARALGRRLQGLSLGAEQLGRGEVPVIEQSTRIREVRQLSEVMHDSAAQLQAYRARVQADARALQQANDSLDARVQQRTAELAASREEALGAARAKAAFLATMSQEIRTPLNGVVGMSTLLAETPLDPEQRDYLETIRLSSDQLLAVINDILDFSKIESGRLELEAEPLSLRAAVEEACDIAAPRAREKGLELIIDIPESKAAEPHADAVPEAIRGDVTRLRQVLINLINNAVKFTEAGEVAIHVRRLDVADPRGRAVIEFRVSDSGIGIPAERLAALFEAFTQGDASTSRKYDGTGLGLAICKRLVELMGGQIGAQSEPGRGPTFWFTVAAPLAQMTPTLNPAEAGALAAKRVLVVDDHATNVRILTRQLQLWGLEVACAESGAQGPAVAGPGREPARCDHHRHAYARHGRRLPGPRHQGPARVARHCAAAAELGLHAGGRRQCPAVRRAPAQAGPPDPAVRHHGALLGSGPRRTQPGCLAHQRRQEAHHRAGGRRQRGQPQGGLRHAAQARR